MFELFCPGCAECLQLNQGSKSYFCPIHGHINDVSIVWENSITKIIVEYAGEINLGEGGIVFESSPVPMVVATQQQTEDSTVVHPSHYNQYEGFEVIDICQQLRSADGGGNFNRGNMFKYLARAGWKPKGDVKKELEDLAKVRMYLEFEEERLRATLEAAETPTTDKRTERDEARKKEIAEQTQAISGRLFGTLEEGLRASFCCPECSSVMICGWSYSQFQYCVKSHGRVVFVPIANEKTARLFPGKNFVYQAVFKPAVGS